MNKLLIAGLLISPLIAVAAGPSHSHGGHHGAHQTGNHGPVFRSVQRYTPPESRPQARLLNQRVTPPPAPVIINHYYQVTPPSRYYHHHGHPGNRARISGRSGDYSFSIQVER